MIKKTAIFLVKLYQKYISPFIRPSCRFVPTCSQYCIESIEKLGLVRGLFYSVIRIFRCNPLFKGGYDPVKKGIRG